MIFILDSHPVQYKAPIYQRLQQIRPDSFRVIYATDSTMRGHHDRDFQTVVTWDLPLLEGYNHTVLHNEDGTPFEGFRSLTGRGVFDLLRRERPSAVLISQFAYAYDLMTYVSCLLLRIPIWIRHETQDEAFSRPAWKTVLRWIFYRLAYGGVDHAFYIGALNRAHLLRHGLAERRLSRAPYCTPIRAGISPALQSQWRADLRQRLGINPDETLLLFSGKFIGKKNPLLIFDALRLFSHAEREHFQLVFVGSGPLEAELRARAAEFPGRVHFAGFVNQSEIAQYYAAADILLLPSRREGETWGLVVNEALQAGCGVVMSRAVGCHPEFGTWERVRVIAEGDAVACSAALRKLSLPPRSFDWCSEPMKAYSVEAAAEAIARQIDTVT
jgi:glycosyltransferase involved in cell wall biosynthesis